MRDESYTLKLKTYETRVEWSFWQRNWISLNDNDDDVFCWEQVIQRISFPIFCWLFIDLHSAVCWLREEERNLERIKIDWIVEKGATRSWVVIEDRKNKNEEKWQQQWTTSDFDIDNEDDETRRKWRRIRNRKRNL